MTSLCLASALTALCTGNTGMVLRGLVGSVSAVSSPVSPQRFPGRPDESMSLALAPTVVCTTSIIMGPGRQIGRLWVAFSFLPQLLCP
jgi:hypothetical protein